MTSRLAWIAGAACWSWTAPAYSASSTSPRFVRRWRRTRHARRAVGHGLRLAAEGADALDVGGESTRPGAANVPLDEELRRVIPVIEQLAQRTTLPISIDTSKPEVMRAAIAAGAGMINDVQSLRRDGALEVAPRWACRDPEHMRGEPRSMQHAPNYDDVVAEVHRFLAERIFAAEMGGNRQEEYRRRPGISALQDRRAQPAAAGAVLQRFTELGVRCSPDCPARRPSRLDRTRRTARSRPWLGRRRALIAAQRGATLLRVHDVAATVDALKVWAAVAAQTDAEGRRLRASDSLVGLD